MCVGVYIIDANIVSLSYAFLSIIDVHVSLHTYYINNKGLSTKIKHVIFMYIFLIYFYIYKHVLIFMF